MAMASLTASLLARKGQARPSAGIHFEPGQPAPQPASRPLRLAVERAVPAAARAEAVAEKVAPVPAEPAPLVSKTVRVDRETHLRLRLLAAGRGVTQQSLMSQALDALLASEEGKGCLCSGFQKK